MQWNDVEATWTPLSHHHYRCPTRKTHQHQHSCEWQILKPGIVGQIRFWRFHGRASRLCKWVSANFLTMHPEESSIKRYPSHAIANHGLWFLLCIFEQTNMRFTQESALPSKIHMEKKHDNHNSKQVYSKSCLIHVRKQTKSVGVYLYILEWPIQQNKFKFLMFQHLRVTFPPFTFPHAPLQPVDLL